MKARAHQSVEWRSKKERDREQHPTHMPNAAPTGRSRTAMDIPRKNNAASNLYDLLGGREGVLDLLEGSTDSKLTELRQLLESEDTGGVRTDGAPKMSFGKMLAVSGATEESVYKVFLSRKRAETVVTLATAEPKLAGELIERASKRKVLCRSCGGTKFIPGETEDEPGSRCYNCDAKGLETVMGDQDSIELFFDLSKLKTHAPFVEVNNDNRSVQFQLGMPGTAPNPLTTIRSLEMVKDAGPRAALNPAPMQSEITLPVKEGELVGK